MNTTTRNIIIAAVIAVLVIGAVVAVILLTKSNDADKINKELANMSNPTASQQDENDEDVTTGEYDHSTEPIIIESEPEEDTKDEDIPEEKVEVIAPDEPEVDTPAQTTKPATTTTATTTRPAVTVVTTTPAVTAPPSTVRTDLPVVTAEPTTAATTATEPDIAVEYDDNGFPADPEPSETFKDDDGQWWIYNPIFGWGEWDGDGSTTMYEFPDFEVEGGDEQILF